MRTDADQVALRDLLRQVGTDGCVADSMEDLIDFCFPSAIFSDPLANSAALCAGAILCPRSNDAEAINNMAMDQLPGECGTFVSLDTPLDFGDSCGPRSVYRSDFNLESVHNETPSGLPPHELRLKVDFPSIFAVV